MSKLLFTRRVLGAREITAAIAASISVGAFQAHAANTITFGANNNSCGGAVMCSTDGTHGYTKDGTGQAFNLSTISQWFQIDLNGSSELSGQPAEPDKGAGAFLVVNDTGSAVSRFSLTVTDDFTSSTPSVHTCSGAQAGNICDNFSAHGGSGSYKFNTELSGADWDRCTQGTTSGQTCTGGSGGVAADVAPNSVTYTWTGQNGSTIPAGSYFVISFSGWNNDGWAPPPPPPPPYAVLYSFCSQPNCADGQLPVGGLILDDSGNLYGTTRGGGLGAPGAATGSVVFELAPNGSETVLHTFSGAPDGYGAQGTLIADSSGNLYGTTVWGGVDAGGGPDTTNHYGTIFKVAPNGTETVLYGFCAEANCADGGYPQTGSLVMDSAGNLYGATDREGANGDAGTIFRLAPNGTETTLYSFCAQPNCSDGLLPPGGLTMDSLGNLYGTATYGGANGDGTVFELAPSGILSVLHAFQGGDGANPFGSLIMDSVGNLYGTTDRGGANGSGTIFKVAPNGTETVLYSFTGGSDGANPYASLVMDNSGNLYGTTTYGGATGDGTVFELAPSGTLTVLHAFQGGSDGAFPYDPLIMDNAGSLYGTTAYGGVNDAGTVFRVPK